MLCRSDFQFDQCNSETKLSNSAVKANVLFLHMQLMSERVEVIKAPTLLLSKFVRVIRLYGGLNLTHNTVVIMK